MLGASLVDMPKPSSGERFNRRKQCARAQFVIFVVLLLYLTFAHRPRRERIAYQKAGSLIKAKHRIGRMIRQRVERQNPLKSCQKNRVDRADAPGMTQMRL